MELYYFIKDYFQKREKRMQERGGSKDKSDIIKKMDEDLLPNGWKKHETETHVTYTTELSESVSEVFKRIDRIRSKFSAV